MTGDLTSAGPLGQGEVCGSPGFSQLKDSGLSTFYLQSLILLRPSQFCFKFPLNMSPLLRSTTVTKPYETFKKYDRYED